jgi:hypothetical protein
VKMPSSKVCARILALHAMLGSSNANEATTARRKLLKLLTANGLTWNDLTTVISAATPNTAEPPSRPPPPSGAPEVNVLDLVLRLVELHISCTSDEALAIALWVLHTYVFQQFQHTPRLIPISPVRGCGKTTFLDLLKLLVPAPFKQDSVSAASLYHLLSDPPFGETPTLLLDEGDNLDLLRNPLLRSVLNSGHARGGSVARFIRGQSVSLPTFAPMAVATIDYLPLPLMHRAVQIHMHRAPRDSAIQRIDEHSPIFAAAQEQVRRWAATCTLDPDPDMAPLHNRAADNWRVLFSIADNLSKGPEARAAARILAFAQTSEDIGVTLLGDIQTVFRADDFTPDERQRMTSADLIAALLALDDAPWNEWTGPNDDRLPRKFTQSELARMLRRFRIRPRTVWPLARQPGDHSSRGYYREQFEDAWRRYCSADTPTQRRQKPRLVRS